MYDTQSLIALFVYVLKVSVMSGKGKPLETSPQISMRANSAKIVLFTCNVSMQLLANFKSREQCCGYWWVVESGYNLKFVRNWPVTLEENPQLLPQENRHSSDGLL